MTHEKKMPNATCLRDQHANPKIFLNYQFVNKNKKYNTKKYQKTIQS